MFKACFYMFNIHFTYFYIAFSMVSVRTQKAAQKGSFLF